MYNFSWYTFFDQRNLYKNHYRAVFVILLMFRVLSMFCTIENNLRYTCRAARNDRLKSWYHLCLFF